MDYASTDYSLVFTDTQHHVHSSVKLSFSFSSQLKPTDPPTIDRILGIHPATENRELTEWRPWDLIPSDQADDVKGRN
jgi:hypothetical protein